MSKHDLDARTPTCAMLWDGLQTWPVRYAKPVEIYGQIAALPRRALDGALRIGPLPGLNRPDVLDAIRLVRDAQIAAAAAALHARRATGQREAGYGGNRAAKAWLRVSRLA